MEKTRDWEQKKALINELTQGRDLAKQLKTHLNASSSPETRQLIAEKMFSSFEKTLSVLKWSGLYGDPQQMVPLTGISDSPYSVNGSPESEDSGHGNVSKKRNASARWTKQVQVCCGTGTGLQGTPDDGYSWRKYGQKGILGSKFPRGYFRCTHRNAQGCLATKRVQRSDDDPSTIEITYRGKHTCVQASPLIPGSAYSEKQEMKPSKDNQQQNQQQSQDVMFNFRAGLKTDNRELTSSFSTPASFGCLNGENYVSLPSASDNNMGSFLPSFMSPTTSESNYFSLSPFHMNNFGADHNNLQTTESDLTEIISVSATTSGTNSPILDMKFPLDPVGFDPDFPFDTKEFFSSYTHELENFYDVHLTH